MGVGQKNVLERRRLDRKRSPVQQPQLLGALKHAAVDQKTDLARIDEYLRAGHCAGSAQELQVCHDSPFA